MPAMPAAVRLMSLAPLSAFIAGPISAIKTTMMLITTGSSTSVKARRVVLTNESMTSGIYHASAFASRDRRKYEELSLTFCRSVLGRKAFFGFRKAALSHCDAWGGRKEFALMRALMPPVRRGE